jgi:CRISPR/Cas system-associated exonuclease Cas4 (RecB family)
MPEPLVLSNSHISQWRTCTRQFWYGSVRNLKPKNMPQAISRGTFGHSLLETWYKTKDTRKLEQVIINALNNNLDLKIATPIYQLVLKYIQHYENEKYYPTYEVELRHTIPLTDSIKFSYKPDLILRIQSDTLVVVDHKFIYDFYDTDLLAFQPQIPKYISALRYEGVPIEYGIVNQIRTRPGVNEIFNRSILDPDDYELKVIWEEHLQAAQEIEQFITNPPDIIPRVNNIMICKGCMFRELCRNELKGLNTEIMVEEHFEPSDYDLFNGSDKGESSEPSLF